MLLDGLIDLGMRGLVTDEQYRAKQTTLTMRRETLLQELEIVDQALKIAKANSHNVLNYVVNARNWLRTGDASLKRIVAHNLGSNYVLTNGNLLLEPHPLLKRLKQEASALSAEFRLIKPLENGSQSTKKAAYATVRSSWSGMWEAIQIFSIERGLAFPDVSEQVSLAEEAAGDTVHRMVQRGKQ